MAKYFTDFSSDTIGQLPSGTILKRNSTTGDYQIADDGGVKSLRFGRSGGSVNARGLSYTGITSSGKVQIYAEIKDLDTNPASGRLICFATDGPDNEYGCYLDRVTPSRITLYRRVGGSFTSLAVFNVSLDNNYRRVRFEVEPGSPNTLRARVWLTGDTEPTTWDIEINDASFDLVSGSQVGGWIGHVGFDDAPYVYYRELGIGTNGDIAPTEPLPTGITLSVNSLSLSMAMDAAALTQSNQLAVDDLQCSTSLDAVTLQQANVLSPDDIALNLQMDSAVLVSAGQLSVNDMQLSMALDAAGLQQANQLLVDDLLLTSSLESPDMSVGLTLVPDSVWLATLLDQVSLTQSHVLTVDDLAMQIALDGTFLIPGDGVVATIMVLPERGTMFRLPKRH